MDYYETSAKNEGGKNNHALKQPHPQALTSKRPTQALKQDRCWRDYAPPNLRAAAQGFIAFVTLGIGGFIGTWLSGRIVDQYALVGESVSHRWNDVWIIPAAAAFLVLVLFAMFFAHRETPSSHSSDTSFAT